MATGILDLNRVEGALERVPTDLIALARRLLVQIEPEDHPITLDPHPAHAAVDPVEVERIIENLVANAVRHTPRGTTIWARFAETADGIILTVEDEGPGVPDAQKETIFRAFQRGRSPRPGTGVGLAVVERFARNHGGRAWVEDRVGGGASFHVFLAT